MPRASRIVLVAALAAAGCIDPPPTTSAAHDDKVETKGDPPAPLDPRLGPTCAAPIRPATVVTPAGVMVKAAALLPAADLYDLGATAVRALAADAQMTWRIHVPSGGALHVWVRAANDNLVTALIDDVALEDPLHAPPHAGWVHVTGTVTPGDHHLDLRFAGAAEIDRVVVTTSPEVAPPFDDARMVGDPPVYAPRAYRFRAFPSARFAVGPADRYADDPTAWTATTPAGGTTAPLAIAGAGGQRVTLAIGVATNPAHFAIPASVEVTATPLVHLGAAPPIEPSAVDVRALSVQATPVMAIGNSSIGGEVWRPQGKLLVTDEAFCARPVPTPRAPTVPPGIQGIFGGGRARGILAPADQRIFWITVQLPPATATDRVGDYHGTVRVVVDGFTGDAVTVPIAVTVKPVALLDAPGTAGAFYYGCRPGAACDGSGALPVDTAAMQRHLADMRAHGLNAIWAAEGLQQPSPSAPRLVDLAASAGLERLAILAGTAVHANATALWYDAEAPGRAGIERWVTWVGDEPPDDSAVTGMLAINTALEGYCAATPTAPPHLCPPDHAHGGAVTINVPPPASGYERLVAEVDVPLLAITAFAHPEYVDKLVALGKTPLYYFALFGVDPLTTRALAGTYPRALGYQGMFVYDYTGGGDHLALAMVVDDDHGFPTPTRDGEAVREGLDDVRLHATLRAALKVRDTDCATPPGHPILAVACATARTRVECVPYNATCDRAAGAAQSIVQYAVGSTTASLDATRDAVLAAVIAVQGVAPTTP